MVDSNLSNREWDDNEMRNEPDKLSFTGANKPNNIHIIKVQSRLQMIELKF